MNPRPAFPLFYFRALLEFDDRYQIYVVHCLETGSVVTADDPKLAQNMMKELLEDEISFAVENGNLSNLFSSPAPIEIWRKWQRAAKNKKPELILLNPTAQRDANTDEPEAEITFATAA